MKKVRKIVVYGAGYVGLANGLLLARKNDVTIFDKNEEIVKLLSSKKVHIDDDGCAREILKTSAKFELKRNILGEEFEYVILALPTNYDEIAQKFDTNHLDETIDDLNNLGFKGTIIIKSTVPMGYTQKKKQDYKNLKIVFSPEFLREGTSFSDASNPSRIVIGNKRMNDVAELFLEVAENSPRLLMTSSTEAEAIKLFANTYLAMRVAFVNELDTFAKVNSLDSGEIINGVGLDPRIGLEYFSPSFGYGGYCLPKDSKQLKYEFNNKKVPSSLFDAIVESNEKRIQFIADDVIKSGQKKFTIHGIGHKPGVTNFRNSPKLEVAKKLRKNGIEVVLVDNNFEGQIIEGFKIKGMH